VFVVVLKSDFFSKTKGHFIANLTWNNEQSNPAVKITGYRIYINGRQYGTDLPESIKAIRIKVNFFSWFYWSSWSAAHLFSLFKLSLEKVFYQIHVTAFAAKPFIESQDSNAVEIRTENFLPFTFYCYRDIHAKNTM
jgi:hypothetical protein